MADQTDAIRTKVIAIVKDESGKLVNPTDYNSAIAAALTLYSKHRPDTAVKDIAGNGTHDLSLPTEWVSEYSWVISAEYPAGQIPEILLDADAYSLYEDATAVKLRIIDSAPSASETVRLTFAIPRTAATIPAGDLEAFCFLTAALCLEMLADAFVQLGDSLIAADAVNYRTKSAEAAARAKRFMQLYRDHMGIKDDDGSASPAAAVAVADYDEKYPGGLERLTHPRWARRKR